MSASSTARAWPPAKAASARSTPSRRLATASAAHKAAAASLSGVVSSEAFHVDIETRGELTRGMMVVDTRIRTVGPANARIATDVSVGEVRQYIDRILKAAG